MQELVRSAEEAAAAAQRRLDEKLAARLMLLAGTSGDASMDGAWLISVFLEENVLLEHRPYLQEAAHKGALAAELRVQAGDGDAEDLERELQDAHLRAADADRKYRGVRSLCLVAQQARTKPLPA